MTRRSWTGWIARLAFAAVTIGGAGASAAERTMSWDSGCRFTVRFDPAKQDETRLRNTVHLLFGPSDFESPGTLPAFEPKAVAGPDPERAGWSAPRPDGGGGAGHRGGKPPLRPGRGG